jgi:hypothetical protein
MEACPVLEARCLKPGRVAPLSCVVRIEVRNMGPKDGAKEYRAREYPRLFPGRGYPTNTLLIVDRLVREEFLIEVSAVAAL